MLKLKSRLLSGEITKAQYDFTLRKLLRVRAFGCECGADLEKSTTGGEGWMCNVCERDLEPGTVVFSCSDCNWDGCKGCLDEAKAANGDVKGVAPQDAGGPGEGQGQQQGSGGDAGKVLSCVEKFRCGGGHLLQQRRTTSTSWSCNVCGRTLPTQAAIYSCRECDWDGCGLCFARAADELPRTAVQRQPAVPQAKDIEGCPEGHELIEYCTPDNQWACDKCKAVAKVGGFMYGCRTCNYDLCPCCFGAEGSGGGNGQGAGGGNGQGGHGGATIAKEVLRLKGARTAGWLTEEEYNNELKKLFASKVSPRPEAHCLVSGPEAGAEPHTPRTAGPVRSYAVTGGR